MKKSMHHIRGNGQILMKNKHSFQRVQDFLNWLESGRQVSTTRVKVRIMKSESNFDWYHRFVGFIVNVTPGFKGLYEVITDNDLRLFINKSNCRKATAHEIKYFKALYF